MVKNSSLRRALMAEGVLKKTVRAGLNKISQDQKAALEAEIQKILSPIIGAKRVYVDSSTDISVEGAAKLWNLYYDLSAGADAGDLEELQAGEAMDLLGKKAAEALTKHFGVPVYYDPESNYEDEHYRTGFTTNTALLMEKIPPFSEEEIEYHSHLIADQVAKIVYERLVDIGHDKYIAKLAIRPVMEESGIMKVLEKILLAAYKIK